MKTLKGLITRTALSLAVLAFVAPGAAAGPKKDDYKRLPGYVDFEGMNMFGDLESTVEVFLKGPLLNMAMEAVKHDDPRAASLLAGLKLIRVNVFDLRRDAGKDLMDKATKLSKKLEDKGWEMAIRVREEDEHVHVYMLPGKGNEIDGLVVMVVESDDEAVFVNVVGTIDPAEIGRLGHSFNIDALDDIDWEHDRDRRRRDRDRDRDED
ncbi:MAG: DUF4252 domain-containing protein [Candidatus Krumholzibacteriia bacterium]